MPQKPPFKVVVAALLDSSVPFPPRYLHSFSDISPADLSSLLKAWPQVDEQRKHALLEDLEELAESDTLTSFDDLARSLLPDADPVIRVGAIRLLWENESPRIASIFLKMMKEDTESEVCAAAANALGLFVYLGELEKISPDLLKTIEDELLTATRSSPDEAVRRRALESLGYSSRPEVIPLLETAYLEKNADWIVSSLFAMGRSSDERWNKQVVAKLRSSNTEIRSEAIHAAGELEISTARPILLDLLEDEEDSALRRELIWALSKIGGFGVRSRLEELLDAETDDEEIVFMEDALDNLTFTEDMGNFDLFDMDPNKDFVEEEFDEEENLD
jgi:HEAT repeat protein